MSLAADMLDALPEDLQQQFAAALESYRDGEALDHALGLAGPRAIKARDAAIRRAGDLMDPDLSAWAVAAKLEKQRRHMDRVVLPRRAPETPLEHALASWIELDTGLRPITRQRAIFAVLNDCTKR